MTSLPKSSKTRTFQIGSPSEFNIGVACGIRPLEDVASFVVEASEATEFKFRIFSIDAWFGLLAN